MTNKYELLHSLTKFIDQTYIIFQIDLSDTLNSAPPIVAFSHDL
jgi:hypothetical protein